MLEMCYQLVELYSACRCIYYKHAVDRCASYGRRGHRIAQRTILVGYTCQDHAPSRGFSSKTTSNSTHSSLKKAIKDIRETEAEREAATLLAEDDKADQSAADKTIEYSYPEKSQEQHAATTIHSTLEVQKNSEVLAIATSDLENNQIAQPNSSAADNSILIDEPIELEVSDDDDVSSSLPSTLEGRGQASSLTSARPYEPPNAIEVLTNAFIYDVQLQYLWPQLFLRSGSMSAAYQHVVRFLLRYSLDLQALADGQDSELPLVPKKKTARFVEKNKRVIAQEICNLFDSSDADTEKLLLEPDGPEPIDKDKDQIDVQEQYRFEEVEAQSFDDFKEFLFRTQPFFSFRENLRLFVEQPIELPVQIRITDFARRLFNVACSSLTKSTPTRDQRRVYYQCRCGERLYDDYVECKPDALNELNLLLQQYGFTTKTANDLETNGVPRNVINSNFVGQKLQILKDRTRDHRLPTYWQNQKRDMIGTCRQKAGATRGDEKHNYILTCIPFGRLLSKLRQPEVCTIDSDQDFFSLLRVTYRGCRSIFPLSFLCRVKSIRFVQFEMYQKDLADIRCFPAVPPSDLSGKADQYFYDPMPADLMPPIGSNLLVHLFENPTHAGALPDLFKRIPKKLREKLSACPRRGTSIGWGLAFTEGIDTFLFFLCGCLGFMLCLVVSLAWTIAKNDVQGGFGIGGFLLSFMVFGGGLIHSSISTRGSL